MTAHHFGLQPDPTPSGNASVAKLTIRNVFDQAAACQGLAPAVNCYAAAHKQHDRKILCIGGQQLFGFPQPHKDCLVTGPFPDVSVTLRACQKFCV
jgi:hypothetical protein